MRQNGIESSCRKAHGNVVKVSRNFANFRPLSYSTLLRRDGDGGKGKEREYGKKMLR